MTAQERDYLKQCIDSIVARYFPEKASLGKNLGQRDLQYLIDLMEERSNIRISLSTMKRLWKNEFNKMPHPSTLDALVSLLDHKNWNAFRQEQTRGLFQEEIDRPKPKKQLKNLWFVLIFGALALALLLILPAIKQREIVLPENVSFSANKTVTHNVPNSVIFSYDLEGVEADSFFIQRSWNPNHKFPIDPRKRNFSQIYYYPGFHWARLIANDSVIRKTRVHVQTDGWFATLKSDRLQDVPTYPDQKKITSNGYLQVGNEALEASGMNPNKNLIVSFFNIREFDGLQNGAFVFETKVRFASTKGLTCPFMEVVLIDEEDSSIFGIIEKGCESNIMLKLGQDFFMGSEHDFSNFGASMDEWQILKIVSKNQTLEVHLNDVLAFQAPTERTFTNIMGMIFTFTGKGIIDYVSLKDLNGEILYSDEFEN